MLDVVGRDQKAGETRALAEKIRRHMAEKDPVRFQRVTISLSYSNDWENLFATQYTLILTGAVREEWDRELAVILAREALGVPTNRIYVTNMLRVER